MLARQRRDTIVDAVRRDGSVRVRDLTALLDVSEMTVRRDLDALASKGLIDKVHGGATRIGGQSADEPGFEAKKRRQAKEKESIAAAAASLVNPGSSVGLTAGTTTWTLAKHLLRIKDLTVVTNGPSIARVFYRVARNDLTVILTGGVRTPSDALVGPIATSSLSALQLDWVFMGIHGMDATHGYSTPNVGEAETNQAFVRAAGQLVITADHTKWGTRGLARIGPLEAADVIVSDDGLPDDGKVTLTEHGVDLHLVSAIR